MLIYVKPSEAELSERKLTQYYRYSQIIQWGRKYPLRFMERFMGVELIDYQKYLYMNSWVTPFNVWVVGRAGGKTTTIATFVMTKGILFPKHQTYILAGVGSQSQEAFRKIEAIAKKEISSFVGATDFFMNEIENKMGNHDGFVHDPSSFSYRLHNASKVNTLNSVASNIRSKRSNLNVYDEAGFTDEDLFIASMPFLTNSSDFAIGGGVNQSVIPKKVPNQVIMVSSASDKTTYFYNKYKDYAMEMLMGNPNYFVGDIDSTLITKSTLNGILLPKQPLTQEVIDQEMRTNKEKALQEYYNQFASDGGDMQPFKRSMIKKYSIVRLPELEANFDRECTYVLAYDPARMHDNSICMIGKLYKDDVVGYKMDIVNGISFADLQKKKKTPMLYQDQMRELKKTILLYNGSKAPDYENVEALLVDAGAGGGGLVIGDFVMENWKDSLGNNHFGIIDRQELSDYIHRYPDAIDILKLVSPRKYKTEMFDALLDMISLGLLVFPEEYDGKDELTFYEEVELDEEIIYEDEEGNLIKTKFQSVPKIVKLEEEEQHALRQIDLAKSELYNMYKYQGKMSTIYDVAPDKKNKVFDDRAYCLAMLGWFLKNKRKEDTLSKVENYDYSIAPRFVSTFTL